ncbi:MAG: hypothetical protein JWO90_1912, partial [Solirubrobacterales bacterium]|nr:hypothetical protein [Solirubrobacterales bacterium]
MWSEGLQIGRLGACRAASAPAPRTLVGSGAAER